MASPQIRLSIANAQLALMGEETRAGEPADWAAKREHYRQQREEALEAISEITHQHLPYRDSE